MYEKYFGSEADLAHAICMAESGCTSKRSYQANSDGTYDWGIFQINEIHRAKVGGNLQLLLDPETNFKVAAQIKNSSGWSAWATYNNGKYKQYLEGK